MPIVKREQGTTGFIIFILFFSTLTVATSHFVTHELFRRLGAVDTLTDELPNHFSESNLTRGKVLQAYAIAISRAVDYEYYIPYFSPILGVDDLFNWHTSDDSPQYNCQERNIVSLVNNEIVNELDDGFGYFDLEIQIKSKCSISRGEELTVEYGTYCKQHR